jgi:Tfp pilus assembly protein PilN
VNAVNLLPDRQGGAKRSINLGGGKRPLAILAGVCVVGALGYWAQGVRSEVSDLRSDVAAATADRDALTAELGTRIALQQRASLVLVRRGAVTALATGRINWERLVRDVAQVLPEGVWLSTISGEVAAASNSAARPNPTGASEIAAPQGLHLEGYAFTQTQVAQLLTRLAAVPGLGQPRLDSSEQILRGRRTVVQFVIDAPVDQRAQDRPTLSVIPAASESSTDNEGFTP